jgi:hypothetical protein
VSVAALKFLMPHDNLVIPLSFLMAATSTCTKWVELELENGVKGTLLLCLNFEVYYLQHSFFTFKGPRTIGRKTLSKEEQATLA